MVTTATDFNVTDEEAVKIRQRWDDLQGQGYQLDHDRAKFLHDIWETRHDKNDGVLSSFLVAIIGEYPGKRISRLLRLVHAYDRNRNAETWAMIGGGPMTLLTRLDGREQRKVLTKVRQTIRSTGRSVISDGSFRLVVRSIVGGRRYGEVRVEKNTGGASLRSKVESLQKKIGALQAELAAFKTSLLDEIRRDPSLTRRLPKAVRTGLGLDKV